jgi:hypothetical protein
MNAQQKNKDRARKSLLKATMKWADSKEPNRDQKLLAAVKRFKGVDNGEDEK